MKSSGLRIKKTNSINKQKTGRFKNKKQNVSKDYKKGIETIESLKHMLSDMTNSRLIGHDINKSEGPIMHLDDENNMKMMNKYLNKTKNTKQPITFKKKINDNLVLVSRARTRSKDQSKPCDETDNDELSNNSPNISQSKNTDIDFDKPLLNSKKNLSKSLISGWFQNESKIEEINMNKNDEVMVNDDSFDKRWTFNDEISQPNYNPPINKKNLRMMKDIRRELNKVRETDPVLSNKTVLSWGKIALKNFTRYEKPLVQVQNESVRRRASLQQKNRNDYQNNSDINNDKIPDELSPIHKLLYKENAK